MHNIVATTADSSYRGRWRWLYYKSILPWLCCSGVDKGAEEGCEWVSGNIK